MTSRPSILIPLLLLTACSEPDIDPRTGDEILTNNDEGTILGVTEDDLASADFVDTTSAALDTAIAYLSGERVDDGVALLQELTVNDPDNIEPHWILGNFFLRNYIGTKGHDIRDIEDAVMHLEKVIEMDADWDRAYYSLAEAHFYWMKFDEAKSYMIEFQSRLDPADEANFQLAQERLLIYEEAIEAQNL